MLILRAHTIGDVAHSICSLKTFDALNPTQKYRCYIRVYIYIFSKSSAEQRMIYISARMFANKCVSLLNKRSASLVYMRKMHITSMRLTLSYINVSVFLWHKTWGSAQTNGTPHCMIGLEAWIRIKEDIVAKTNFCQWFRINVCGMNQMWLWQSDFCVGHGGSLEESTRCRGGEAAIP